MCKQKPSPTPAVIAILSFPVSLLRTVHLRQMNRDRHVLLPQKGRQIFTFYWKHMDIFSILIKPRPKQKTKSALRKNIRLMTVWELKKRKKEEYVHSISLDFKVVEKWQKLQSRIKKVFTFLCSSHNFCYDNLHLFIAWLCDLNNINHYYVWYSRTLICTVDKGCHQGDSALHLRKMHTHRLIRTDTGHF